MRPLVRFRGLFIKYQSLSGVKILVVGYRWHWDLMQNLIQERNVMSQMGIAARLSEDY